MTAATQTPAEKRAPHDAWHQTPAVVALTDALAAHGLRSLPDAEAITALPGFATAWQAANGKLPDSGILCG